MIEENVKASRAADDAFAFICEEWQNVPPRFWERLQELIRDGKLPVPPAPAREEAREMSHLEALRFEQQFMPPKGKHASSEIRGVPCDYLAWWCDNATDNFTKQLQRYVKSARFRERERAEG